MSDLNINYHHPAWAEFQPEWDMIGDCVDGERKIKKAGKKYLPHPSDDSASDDPTGSRYESYKKRAAFVNATGRTLSGLIGIAFSKQPVIELKGGIEGLNSDADGEGQPLSQLIRDALSQNLKRGRAGVLADFTGSGIQSQAEKGRPILRLFTAKQIINWRVTNGKTSLVVVKYEEPEDDHRGFELAMKKYWIELRLVNGVAHWRKWEQGTDSITGTELTPFTDASNIPLSELPWAWIGSSNNDHTPDSPPLADIAYLNIKHYQCEADLAEAAHTVGQPMVGLTGLTNDWVNDHLQDGFVVGSRKGVMLPVGGDLKFAQPEDRNLILSVAERREKQMAMLGAKLVERNTSARTAAQATDEAQTDNSVLSLCAGNVEQAIHRALDFAILFAGGGEYTVTLNKQYEIAQLDSQAITALMAAVQSGNMRVIDFIRYQQRVGLVPQDERAEDIEQELKDAEPTFTGITNDDNQRSVTE
ncbi:hypothetical protein SOASR030_02040 [Leminorella grimontii]|uniref:DUF4055 domain-containing protein n=1 Tax=Leminorella grimontii TaxID=82981 RepID=A0AAV5N0W5_9GAMM|nr:DUF4055 domain-containing protein [Leminorella grimontii]KFC95726.1 structural protein [Leminorella grimontii ATCC 33999 = DSM 5078]GKX54092.1 hypothetical protein SOASR030_02040 [Leminorella grimontii]